MKSLSLLVIIILSFTLSSCNNTQEQNPKPNIIYILADDLGYGELGCYGQEKIETPAIDKLAESGMMFTQHYSGAPVCAPSRCVLLTGKHSGHAFIRGNHEWGERGDVWSYTEMIQNPELEGQYPLPEGTVTIGTLLQDAGYKTAIIGKWGLGAPRSTGRHIPITLFICGKILKGSLPGMIQSHPGQSFLMALIRMTNQVTAISGLMCIHRI